MENAMRFARRMATLGIATGLASVLLSTDLAAQTSAPPTVARSEPLVGTVRAVDYQTRTLDLLTGVGHALRVRHIQLPAGVGIRAQGVETRLTAALTPGSIVRVECRSTGPTTEATSVELLPTSRSRTP